MNWQTVRQMMVQRRKSLSISAIVLILVLWGSYATRERVQIDGSHRITDTYRIWSGRNIWRRIVEFEKPEEAEKGIGMAVFSANGPVSESGKWHGKWTMFSFKPSWYLEHKFYWYGEEITEGEWHLRNGSHGFHKEISDENSEPIEEPNIPDERLARHPHIPEDVVNLADWKLRDKFKEVSFSWPNGPVPWDLMTPELRRQAFGIGGPFVRNDYGNARILECYYDAYELKSRWQEELRNGAWTRHGPEVFYHLDGGYEILFWIDDEVEGPRRFYNADGTLREEQWYEAGIQLEKKPTE